MTSEETMDKTARISDSEAEDVYEDDSLDLLDTSTDIEAIWKAKLEAMTSNCKPENKSPTFSEKTDYQEEKSKYRELEHVEGNNKPIGQPDVVSKSASLTGLKFCKDLKSTESRLPDVVVTDKNKLSNSCSSTKSSSKEPELEITVKSEDVSIRLGSRYQIDEDLEDFESDSDSESARIPSFIKFSGKVKSNDSLDDNFICISSSDSSCSPPKFSSPERKFAKAVRKYSKAATNLLQTDDFEDSNCVGHKYSSELGIKKSDQKSNEYGGKLKRQHQKEVEEVTPEKMTRLSDNNTSIEISDSGDEGATYLSQDSEKSEDIATPKKKNSESLVIRLGDTIKETDQEVQLLHTKEQASRDQFHPSVAVVTSEEINQVMEMFPTVSRKWIEKEILKLKKQHVSDYMEHLIDIIVNEDPESASLSGESLNSPVTEEPDVVVALGNNKIDLSPDIETDSSRPKLQQIPSSKAVPHGKNSVTATSLKGKAKSSVKKKPIRKFTDELESMGQDEDVNMVCDDGKDSGITEVTSSSLMCESCKMNLNCDKVVQCNEGHLICNSCVEREVKVILSPDSQETSIKCACDQCNSTVPESQATKILPSLIIDLLKEKQHKQAMDSISKMDDLVTCPNCSFPVVIDDGIKQFECPCCKEQSCRYCKRMWEDSNHEDCNRFSQYSPDNSKDLEPPSYWTAMPEEGDKDYVIVQLDKQSVEFTHVMNLFQKSMISQKINKIWRIQNPRLWQKFCLARKHMVEDIGRTQLNEKQLFHGTATAAFDSILREGLDWRMCGLNGTAYGQGTYFAKLASVSDTYTHKHVIKSNSSWHRGNSSFAQAQNLPSAFPGLASFGTTYNPLPFNFGNTQQQSAGFSINVSNTVSNIPVGVFGVTPVSKLAVNPGFGSGQRFGSATTSFNSTSDVFRTSSNTNSLKLQTESSSNISHTLPNQSGQQASSQEVSSTTDKAAVSSVDEILEINNKYLFVARVLVGRTCTGHSSIRKPPIDNNDPKRRPFNSCVDVVGNSSIFVIFDCAQSYPEYLIDYKK